MTPDLFVLMLRMLMLIDELFIDMFVLIPLELVLMPFLAEVETV